MIVFTIRKKLPQKRKEMLEKTDTGWGEARWGRNENRLPTFWIVFSFLGKATSDNLRTNFRINFFLADWRDAELAVGVKSIESS